MLTPPKGHYLTLTVQRSWVTEHPATGAISLLLETDETEPIAIPLTLERISILRDDLQAAELLLRPGEGSA